MYRVISRNLWTVVVVILTGCATFQRLPPPVVTELDFSAGKTTNLGPVEINIPAGLAQDTILDWAEQSDWNVLCLPDDVEGVHTAEVKGLLLPLEAIDRLLDGTGLEFTWLYRSGGIVKRK
jgi:hypothetical protein